MGLKMIYYLGLALVGLALVGLALVGQPTIIPLGVKPLYVKHTSRLSLIPVGRLSLTILVRLRLIPDIPFLSL